jgi:hypothetical protein
MKKNYNVRLEEETIEKIKEIKKITRRTEQNVIELLVEAEYKKLKGDEKMGKYFVSLYGRISTSYCIYDEDLNFLKATRDKKETENLTELFKKSDITLSFYDDNELVGTTKGEIPDQLYKKGTRIEGAATAAAKAFKPKNWK